MTIAQNPYTNDTKITTVFISLDDYNHEKKIKIIFRLKIQTIERGKFVILNYVHLKQ